MIVVNKQPTEYPFELEQKEKEGNKPSTVEKVNDALDDAELLTDGVHYAAAHSNEGNLPFIDGAIEMAEKTAEAVGDVVDGVCKTVEDLFKD